MIKFKSTLFVSVLLRNYSTMCQCNHNLNENILWYAIYCNYWRNILYMQNLNFIKLIETNFLFKYHIIMLNCHFLTNSKYIFKRYFLLKAVFLQRLTDSLVSETKWIHLSQALHFYFFTKVFHLSKSWLKNRFFAGDYKAF